MCGAWTHFSSKTPPLPLLFILLLVDAPSCYNCINFSHVSYYKKRRGMAQQTQEQEHDNQHRDGQRHPLPLWVHWFIVLFVPLVFIVGAMLGIIQGCAGYPAHPFSKRQFSPWNFAGAIRLFPSSSQGRILQEASSCLDPDDLSICSPGAIRLFPGRPVFTCSTPGCS